MTTSTCGHSRSYTDSTAGKNQMPRRCAMPIRTCPAFSRSVCRLTASNCRSSSSI